MKQTKINKICVFVNLGFLALAIIGTIIERNFFYNLRYTLKYITSAYFNFTYPFLAIGLIISLISVILFQSYFTYRALKDKTYNLAFLYVIIAGLSFVFINTYFSLIDDVSFYVVTVLLFVLSLIVSVIINAINASIMKRSES